MSTTQVIFVSPMGSVTSLDTKKGKGIDVKKMGIAEVVRSSEINWLSVPQKYCVKFLNLSKELIKQNNGVSTLLDANGDVRLFDDYEEAVEAEIIHINKTRSIWGVHSI